MRYTVTYSCGHTGIVDLEGRSKERQWKLEQMGDVLCPECKEAEHKAIAAQSKEMGLPELNGSEKQIAWANQIRLHFFKAIEDFLRYYNTIRGYDPQMIISALKLKTSASWWIENRKELTEPFTIDRALVDELITELNHNEGDKKSAVEDNSIFEPETITHKDTINIHINGNTIALIYVKEDDFRACVKEWGFQWNPNKYRWEKEILSLYGPTLDRAADYCTRLLAKGYRVKCNNDEVKTMIISGQFKPEYRKWILGYNSNNDLLIYFDKDDKLKEMVKKLGAHWDWGALAYRISSSKYREIEDFANLYGFKLNNIAKRRLRQAYASIKRVVAEPEKKDANELCNPPKENLHNNTDHISQED